MLVKENAAVLEFTISVIFTQSPLEAACHFKPVVSAESATNFGTISEDCA
jgi:hypothetical protein